MRIVPHLKKQAPINREVARELAKSQQALILLRRAVLPVGQEDLVPLLEGRIQAIDRSDHRMAKSIDGRRELDGHERNFFPMKEAEIWLVFVNAGLVLKVGKNGVDHVPPDDCRQEI